MLAVPVPDPSVSHRHRPPPRHRLRLLRVALIAAMAVPRLLYPHVASAHAHLAWADPAPYSVLAQAPSVGAFLFDEPLNPALTRVHITDAAGRAVTADTGRLAPGHGGELWLLPLPRLVAGTYSVFWTSESATDGHVMGSFYTFRVAPSGSASGGGAVSGAAAGSYGDSGGAGGGIGLGTGALATALAHWVSLMAQALWLGALIVELVVLAPARRSTAPAEARLAWAATRRVWWLVRATIVVTAVALAGEVLSLALQGTGGDLGHALDPGTLGGILSSQNGHTVVARWAILLLALVVAVASRAPASAVTGSEQQQRPHRSPRPRQALGIVSATPTSFAATTAAGRWEQARLPLTVLALLYMLVAAFAGHAADVTPAALSYTVDWLHLVCTAAWAGGIAALAWGVMPVRRLLVAAERASAVLPLLDRFSPVAYAAVAVLTLSGLYNAVNHLDAPVRLVDTLYGQLLDVKVALVGVLMLLSAAHVFVLRPRIARQLPVVSRQLPVGAPSVRPRRRPRQPEHSGGRTDGRARATTTGDAAGVGKGLVSLARTLYLEGMVGAAILLATALMGQTLPSNTSNAASTAPSSAPAAPVPSSITATTTTGGLRATLTVAPPTVGTTTFTLRLQETGTALTGDTAAAIIHLYPPGQPTLVAPLDTTAHGDRFTVRGSLAAASTWRADVLVRTATVNSYRTLSFTFSIGPGAAFLTPGSGSPSGRIAISVAPGLLTAANTFTISGVRAGAVRVLSQSLDMRMGVIPYLATALGGDRWRLAGVYAPMNGRWELTVQAQTGANGPWTTAGRYVYQVPISGPMRLISSRP